MEAMLESTSKMVTLELGPKFHGCVPARIWEGTTASGVKFQAFVVCVAVAAGQDQAEADVRRCWARDPLVLMEGTVEGSGEASHTQDTRGKEPRVM